MSTRYKFDPKESMNLRPDHHTDNYATGRLAGDAIGGGNELFVASQEKTKDGKVIQKVGDTWLKVIEGGTSLPVSGGSPMGWVAVIHMGISNGVLTDTQTPPPPEPTPIFPLTVSVRVDLPDEKSIVVGVQNEEVRKSLITYTDYEFTEVIINGDEYVKRIIIED